MRTMINKKKVIFLICWLALLLCNTQLVAAQEAASVDLTSEEKTWLTGHPVIRVSSEPDYIPFDFRIDGRPAGYSVDFVKLLTKKLGVRLEFVKDTWSNILKRAEKKEIDLVHSIFNSPKERERYLHFTKPYKEVLNALIVRRDQKGINSIKDLAHKKVAMLKNDSIVAFISSVQPEAEHIYFDS
jgi:two-component system, sensor histidine kinase and response regulator